MTGHDRLAAQIALDYIPAQTGGEQWRRGAVEQGLVYGLDGLRRVLEGADLVALAGHLANGEKPLDQSALDELRMAVEALTGGLLDARAATQQVAPRAHVGLEVLESPTVTAVMLTTEEEKTPTVETSAVLVSVAEPDGDLSEPVSDETVRARRTLRPRGFDRLHLVFDGIIDDERVAELRELPPEVQQGLVDALEAFWRQYAGTRGRNNPISIQRIGMMLVDGMSPGDIASMSGVDEVVVGKGFESVNRVLKRVPEAELQEVIRRALEHRMNDENDGESLILAETDKKATPEQVAVKNAETLSFEVVAQQLGELLGYQEGDDGMRALINSLNPSASVGVRPSEAQRTVWGVVAHKIIDELGGLYQLPLSGVTTQRLREMTGIYKNVATQQEEIRTPRDTLATRIAGLRHQGNKNHKTVGIQTTEAVHELVQYMKGLKIEGATAAASGEVDQALTIEYQRKQAYLDFAAQHGLGPEVTDALWHRCHRGGQQEEYTDATRSALTALQNAGAQKGVLVVGNSGYTSTELSALRQFLLQITGAPKSLGEIQELLGERDAEDLLYSYVKGLV